MWLTNRLLIKPVAEIAPIDDNAVEAIDSSDNSFVELEGSAQVEDHEEKLEHFAQVAFIGRSNGLAIASPTSRKGVISLDQNSAVMKMSPVVIESELSSHHDDGNMVNGKQISGSIYDNNARDKIKELILGSLQDDDDEVQVAGSSQDNSSESISEPVLESSYEAAGDKIEEQLFRSSIGDENDVNVLEPGSSHDDTSENISEPVLGSSYGSTIDGQAPLEPGFSYDDASENISEPVFESSYGSTIDDHAPLEPGFSYDDASENISEPVFESSYGSAIDGHAPLEPGSSHDDTNDDDMLELGSSFDDISYDDLG